ncbi:MAG: RNA polymerase sigma factor RpoD/SigA [Candidatus Omnitrophica bacterium]|nr:RNA polymerase sigma factor RpoD/SigA [Candidatus Omnitrophota bacterium]
MDAVNAYLEKIKNIPLLSEEEEREAVIAAKKGDIEMRRKLINANLKLVVNIAKHYVHFDLPLMDLIAEGNIGLMRAIDKFNPKKGYRFSTYAAWWIRQAITRALIDQGKTIRIPVYMSELISKYKKAKEKLWQKFNREPTREEIAEALRFSIKKVSEIEMWIQKKASLEAPVGEDGESQLGDFIEAKNYTETVEEIEHFFERERIYNYLDFVSPRERKVLDLRFGIKDGSPHTLAEVAKLLNISRERVRQIEKEAIEKLRGFVLQEQKKGVV